MTFVIVENLRTFFNSRPPLVVFMICLASFAVALITFAYIVKTKDLPNPDVTEDWNSFLEKISHLKFCVSHNVTSQNASTLSTKVGDRIAADAVDIITDKFMEHKNSNEGRKFLKREAGEIGARSLHHVKNRLESAVGLDETTWNPSKVHLNKDGLLNETFNLNIEFVPSAEFPLTVFKSTSLTAELTGNLLNMKGSHKEELILMTVLFSANNNSDCVDKVGNTCSMYLISSCITFTGPVSILPRSRHVKKRSCSGETSPPARSLARPLVVSTTAISNKINWCMHGATFTVQYSFDDSLTVLLSQEDRSAINLHLMRTSYFLFVMVVTLFCYAAVKGRPGKVKTVIYANVDKIKIST